MEIFWTAISFANHFNNVFLQISWDADKEVP